MCQWSLSERWYLCRSGQRLPVSVCTWLYRPTVSDRYVLVLVSGNTYLLNFSPPPLHTHTHSLSLSLSHKLSLSHTHIHAHTYTHIRTHARTHALTHAHIHTNKQQSIHPYLQKCLKPGLVCSDDARNGAVVMVSFTRTHNKINEAKGRVSETSGLKRRLVSH